MKLKDRLTEGVFIKSSPTSSQAFSPTSSQAVVGRTLAQNLNLKVDSSFYLAVPSPGRLPQLKKLKVSGIVDLGRHDFNSRYTAVSLQSAKNLLGASGLTGFRLLLDKEKKIKPVLQKLKTALSDSYWIRDWKFIHQNLFTAIQMEKVMIFIVLLILVVAAGFNMSNQMLLYVLKRFHDIGILKAMGARPAVIAQVFLIRTAMMSFLGIFLGFAAALLLCYGLFGFYNVWGSLIPADVYELNEIVLDFRGVDFLSVFIFSAFICLLSSWIPIRKALKLSPCEGLRFN